MICVSKHRLKATRSTKCRLIEIYVTKSGHTWRFTKLNADKQKSEVPNADIQGSTIPNANIQGSTISNADIQRSRIPNADMHGSTIPNGDTERLQLIIERLSMLNADTERSMEPTEDILLSTQNRTTKSKLCAQFHHCVK